MNEALAILPSWRPGATRDSILAFLAAAESVPVEQRVAAFDNDGTLMCERPTFVQFDFFAEALGDAAAADPALRDRPEFAAVLAGDSAAIAQLGVERVGFALLELFAGIGPEEFTERSKAFMGRARHRTLGIPLRSSVYQPMLELLDELRRREFTIFIVSGSGTEFLRAISDDVYRVPAEAVVGTLIAYEFSRNSAGHPVLRRTATIASAANEGAAKVTHIQSQLGRRPILAGGNSGGDREMMEWACASSGPSLALLIDHDDEEREFRYVSSAATFAEDEPITTVAHRLGWTVVSIADDWATVFPS